jgi:hypothetical protein
MDFNNNIIDRGGRDFPTFACNSSSLSFVNGKSDKALKVTSNCAAYSYNPAFDNLREFTIALWCQRDDLTASSHVVYKHVIFNIQIGSGSVSFSITPYFSDGVAATVNNTNAQWHHYAVSWDGSTATIVCKMLNFGFQQCIIFLIVSYLENIL